MKRLEVRKKLEKIKDWLKKINARQKILILYSILAGFLSYFLWDLYNKTIEEMPFAPKPKHYIATIVLVLLSIPFFAWLNYLKESEEKFYDEYEKYFLNKSKNKRENNGNSDENIEKDENQDTIRNMIKNNKEIREYFKITKRQERISYVISIMCAIAGVVMLMRSVFSIFENEGIKATIISVISGAITEVVSGIVLWIHNKSAMQLNYYYDALHENEKFLSAINLADKLEETEKKEMYMEIIKAQIRVREENKENEK